MAQKNEHELGKLCLDGKSYRDAVHVAVIKCEAQEELSPGQSVYVSTNYDGGWNAHLGGRFDRPKHGIVDPFLSANVNMGDFFLVILMPGTVTGLRHTWSHPDISDEKVDLEEKKNEDEYDFYEGCRGCY